LMLKVTHSFGLPSELIQLAFWFDHSSRCVGVQFSSVNLDLSLGWSTIMLCSSVDESYLVRQADDLSVSLHASGQFNEIEVDSLQLVLCFLIIDAVNGGFQQRSIFADLLFAFFYKLFVAFIPILRVGGLVWLVLVIGDVSFHKLKP